MKFVGSKRAVRSPEFHKRKELERKLRLGGLVLLISTAIVLPIYFLGSEMLQVREVSVYGNIVTTSGEVEKLVRESIRGEYFGLVPRSNTFFLPKRSIGQLLVASVPRFASVNLSREGFDGVRVDIVERVPKALYCFEGCYFLDDDGYIYSEAPNFDGEAYVEYRDESLASEPVGKFFLTREKFVKLHNFVESLKLLKLEPKTFIRSNGVNKIVLDEGVELIWRESQDLDKLFIDLSSFINDNQLKNLRISDLLYIDMSFNNKVHWVYKDGR
jgi:cell division septal protein FtsQ